MPTNLNVTTKPNKTTCTNCLSRYRWIQKTSNKNFRVKHTHRPEDLKEIADNKWTVLHDIAVHCKRQFPRITTKQLRKVIPILFEGYTGYKHLNPEIFEKVIAQVKFGKIKQ